MTVESRVKNFNPQSGYGFIYDPGGGRDIFVHATEVHKAGLDMLAPNQVVTFEIADPYGKGPQAVNLSAGDCPHCGGTGRRVDERA